MKYHFCLLQENGLRPYLGRAINLTNTTAPAVPEDVPQELCHQVVSDLVCRAIGWEYLCRLLTPGSIGVEIGVDHGDGAVRLLNSGPSELHLIDPWESSDTDAWYSQGQDVMDKRYQSVVDRFEGDSRVNIHRGKSSDVMRTFSDNSADWVFIDGDHSREAVLDDLRQSLRIVRPGGIIAGDDMHGCAKWFGPVSDAYKQFLSECGDLVSVVWDRYDPFILRKAA